MKWNRKIESCLSDYSDYENAPGGLATFGGILLRLSSDYGNDYGLRLSTISGKSGGKSKQSGSKIEANDKQEQPASEKEKEDEKEKEKENECYPPNPLAGGSEKKKRFTPPTVEQVAEYCQEKGYHIDPEAFVAFYTRNAR